jgi:hypothetical protein
MKEEEEKMFDETCQSLMANIWGCLRHSAVAKKNLVEASHQYPNISQNISSLNRTISTLLGMVTHCHTQLHWIRMRHQQCLCRTSTTTKRPIPHGHRG